MSDWICQECNSQIESDFDVCWNCGTSSDGSPNADFAREVDVATLPAGWVQRIRCESCGYFGKVLKGHHGYKWWTLPVALLMGCSLVGFVPWVIFFLVFGNRTFKACPECDARDRLVDQDGVENEITPESEEIWRLKQDADLASFKKNKLVVLAIALTALVVVVGLLVARTNQS